jgi:hypothetical protein
MEVQAPGPPLAMHSTDVAISIETKDGTDALRMATKQCQLDYLLFGGYMSLYKYEHDDKWENLKDEDYLTKMIQCAAAEYVKDLKDNTRWRKISPKGVVPNVDTMAMEELSSFSKTLETYMIKANQTIRYTINRNTQYYGKKKRSPPSPKDCRNALKNVDKCYLKTIGVQTRVVVNIKGQQTWGLSKRTYDHKDVTNAIGPNSTVQHLFEDMERLHPYNTSCLNKLLGSFKVAFTIMMMHVCILVGGILAVQLLMVSGVVPNLLSAAIGLVVLISLYTYAKAIQKYDNQMSHYQEELFQKHWMDLLEKHKIRWWKCEYLEMGTYTSNNQKKTGIRLKEEFYVFDCLEHSPSINNVLNGLGLQVCQEIAKAIYDAEYQVRMVRSSAPLCESKLFHPPGARRMSFVAEKGSWKHGFFCQYHNGRVEDDYKNKNRENIRNGNCDHFNCLYCQQHHNPHEDWRTYFGKKCVACGVKDYRKEQEQAQEAKKMMATGDDFDIVIEYMALHANGLIDLTAGGKKVVDLNLNTRQKSFTIRMNMKQRVEELKYKIDEMEGIPSNSNFVFYTFKTPEKGREPIHQFNSKGNFLTFEQALKGTRKHIGKRIGTGKNLYKIGMVVHLSGCKCRTCFCDDFDLYLA